MTSNNKTVPPTPPPPPKKKKNNNNNFLTWDLGIFLTQLGLTTLVKRARISNPSLKALLQRLVAYPATGKFRLLQMYYAVFMKPDRLVSAG